MNSKIPYRLQPLLQKREQVKQQAEQSLADRTRELSEEEQRLADVEKHEAELLDLKQRVKSELLGPASGKQLTGEDIRQRLNYLRGVDQDVEAAKGEVFAQKQVVDESQVKLIQARQYLADCAREVEVLEKHREKQEVRHRNELERKESNEFDEAGTRLFISKRKIT
jgi:flagellar export protein FliJ